MRILMIAGAIGVAFATAPAARAGDCADTSQAGMNRCADQAYKKTDAELNALYRQIERRLKSDADTTKTLVAAQKAWLAFRDAECRFAASGVEGGSVYPMVLTQCLDGLTNQRVKDFKGYLSCQEGDMSCPTPPAD
jgi:uncharacterized protein YecT (DUF1311 family)